MGCYGMLPRDDGVRCTGEGVLVVFCAAIAVQCACDASTGLYRLCRLACSTSHDGAPPLYFDRDTCDVPSRDTLHACSRNRHARGDDGGLHVKRLQKWALDRGGGAWTVEFGGT